MAKTATYSLIASTTLTGTSAQIDFNSIPGTFTDLVMVISAVSNSNDNIFYRFNGSSSAFYYRNDLYGTGTTASSIRATSQTQGRLTNYAYPSTTVGEQNTIWHIMDYANTTTYKTSICRSNRASSGVDAIVNLFSSTSAITSISLATNTFTGTANLQSGTTVKLYGIQAGSN